MTVCCTPGCTFPPILSGIRSTIPYCHSCGLREARKRKKPIKCKTEGCTKKAGGFISNYFINSDEGHCARHWMENEIAKEEARATDIPPVVGKDLKKNKRCPECGVWIGDRAIMCEKCFDVLHRLMGHLRA